MSALAGFKSTSAVCQQIFKRITPPQNASKSPKIKSSALEAVSPFVKSGDTVYIQQAAATPTAYV